MNNNLINEKKNIGMRFIFYRKIKKKKKSIFFDFSSDPDPRIQIKVKWMHNTALQYQFIQYSKCIQVLKETLIDFSLSLYPPCIIPMDNIQSVCFRGVFRGGIGAPPTLDLNNLKKEHC